MSRERLGESDHKTILLVPKYRQKLKTIKPTTKVVKTWTPQAIEMLQDCFDSTDWTVFKSDGHGDIHTFTDTVTSYMQYCVCIPEKRVTTFGNNKPWLVSVQQRPLCRKKYQAFKSGDVA